MPRGLFLERAAENGRTVNTRVSRTDQGAYINYAIKLKESGYTEVGSRNRMPMYPLLHQSFPAARRHPAHLFRPGKTVNTVLALAGFCLVGAIFLSCFPRHHALNLLFLTTFTVFLFKAPHVQAGVVIVTCSPSVPSSSVGVSFKNLPGCVPACWVLSSV